MLQNNITQCGDANLLLQFLKSLSGVDKASLLSWSEFLQKEGVDLEEANGSHFDLWLNQLRNAGVSTSAIDGYWRVVSDLYHFLSQRGVSISLGMFDALSTPPSSRTGSTSTSTAPRLQLLKGEPDAPTNSSKSGTTRGHLQHPAHPKLTVALSLDDEQQIVERFLASLTDKHACRRHRNALSQWSKFLLGQGVTISKAGPESLEDWKTELIKRDKAPKTASNYAGYVAAFYRWLNSNYTIAYKGDRQQEPYMAPEQTRLPFTYDTPDVRDRKVREAFLSFCTSSSQAHHYSSALSSLSRFLGAKNVCMSTAEQQQHLIADWESDLRKRNLTPNTVTRYITAATAFYRWCGFTNTPVPSPAQGLAGSAASTPALDHSSSEEALEALRSLPEVVDGLVAKVTSLVAASGTHEHRLAALDAKLAALSAAPTHELASKRDIEDLVSRQSTLEYQWELANAALADKVNQFYALANKELAAQAERVAWAKEMEEMAKQVRSSLYQRADAVTKETLLSQPQAGSSCVEEIELLIDGCFRGLETSNSDIIEGAAKLDKAPQGRAWADKLHKALLALDSYAQSDFDGDFKAFCESMPPGQNVVPTTWVARHEPAATANTERSREARTFPVPPAVAQDGCLFMPEHIILGNGGIGPRLHYYDDRRGQTRKVHIGYIGPHLLSRDTA